MRDLSSFKKSRRVDWLQRFRSDHRIYDLFKIASQHQVVISPIYAWRYGSISGYRVGMFRANDFVCGFYESNVPQFNRGSYYWPIKLVVKQIESLDFVVMRTQDKEGNLCFFVRPVSELLLQYGDREYFTLHIPVLFSFTHATNRGKRPLCDWSDYHNAFHLLHNRHDEKTAPAVPVNPVSSSPA